MFAIPLEEGAIGNQAERQEARSEPAHGAGLRCRVRLRQVVTLSIEDGSYRSGRVARAPCVLGENAFLT